MENDDKLTIEGILLDGDYYDDPEEVFLRETNSIKFDRFIVLDLSGLNLDEISETIELLEELQVLDLLNNDISFLPSEISKLKNLQIVKIEGNRIKTLPFGCEHIEFDIDVGRETDGDKVANTRTRKLKNKKKRFADKICTWCNVARGYVRHTQRSEGTWGFSRHHSQILICVNCSYMHSFYDRRSFFDINS